MMRALWGGEMRVPLVRSTCLSQRASSVISDRADRYIFSRTPDARAAPPFMPRRAAVTGWVAATLVLDV